MKRVGTIIIAIALVLGLSQCKKRVETITADNQGILINVKVANGSKYDVNTSNDLGKVTFTNGDFLWVVNGGYVKGVVTYDESTEEFSGLIGIDQVDYNGDYENEYLGLSTDDYLWFCFTSNLNPEVINGQYILNIGDQREQLPVLSIGHTAEFYQEGETEFECFLENKCALVKFTTPATNDDVKIMGVKTSVRLGVSVNEAGNGIGGVGIFPTDETGIVALNSKSTTEKWAILIPQDGVEDADVLVGNYRCGNAVSIPEITDNALITNDGEGIDINTNTITGYEPQFYIGAGKWVTISSGNLQYNGSTEEWRFAPFGINETGYIGTWNPDSWVDLFGNGTWTGDNPSPLRTENSYNNPYPWDDNDFQGTLEGYDTWRTLSRDEWGVLLFSRPDNKRYIKAVIGANPGLNGLIIFPDGYKGEDVDSGLTYNNYQGYEEVTMADFYEKMLPAGAVFLPAAGRRNGLGIDMAGSVIAYWSSTFSGDFAMHLYGDNYGMYPNNWVETHYGCAVRLVREVE